MQDEFAPAVEAAVRQYEARFGSHLCAVYLSGSLAYDEGLPGVSDMDIYAFMDREPEPSDLQWRTQSEEVLGRQYPQVEHFHLNINSLDFVAKEAVWRFILRYNSFRLRGEDIVTALEQRGVVTPAPTREFSLSRLEWTRKCFQGVVEGQVPKELGTLPENPYLATRKLARNFVILEGAYLLMAEGEFVSFRPQDVLRQLRCRYPQWEELYALTEATQHNPVAAAVTPKRFMDQLAPFMEWAIARIEAALIQVAPLLRSVRDRGTFLREADPADLRRQLHTHESTGRPLSRKASVARLEMKVGRPLAPRWPGRPRKEGKT